MVKNKILLIGAVCLAPLIAGWALYLSGWRPTATGNYGELIPPRPLAGAPFEPLRGKWVLVMFDTAACDAHCEKKLYFMRQVRTATHKDATRVERLWILTDAGKPGPEVLSAIEGTRTTPYQDAPAAKDFPNNTVDHLYIVDPLGNLMMHFPRDPNPSKILKDVQRLLRLSQIG